MTLLSEHLQRDVMVFQGSDVSDVPDCASAALLRALPGCAPTRVAPAMSEVRSSCSRCCLQFRPSLKLRSRIFAAKVKFAKLQIGSAFSCLQGSVLPLCDCRRQHCMQINFASSRTIQVIKLRISPNFAPSPPARHCVLPHRSLRSSSLQLPLHTSPASLKFHLHLDRLELP